MKILKLVIVVAFASTLFASLSTPQGVSSQTSPTPTPEAPAGFDNQTNGFEPQGTPVPPGEQNPVPGNFESDKFIFSVVDEVADGLGPVYNAQSCRECHQNPVTGGISQISELRAGHSGPGGQFIDAPGGSLINDRAIDAKLQERVPDGPRIVFRGPSVQISVMGFDGGQYGPVGNTPTTGFHPAFSPDGKQIVFARVSGSNTAWAILVMNNDGTDLRQLTSGSTQDVSPDWSPDGTKIVFQSHRTGRWQIFTMNPDGSNQTQISNGVADDIYPTWSPDGTKIAFTRTLVGVNMKPDIWKFNPDGTGETQLTFTPSAFEARTTWSPDGTMIAFQTDRDGNYEIYKMTAAGASQTRLTTNAAADTEPTWSPDGSEIAFASDRSGSVKSIWGMAADGSSQTRLSVGFGEMPSFSKDAGETVRTFRASLNLLGDGFVEATEDAELLAIRDSQPPGVRGTALLVPILEAPGEQRVGRFGWKTQHASLLSFSSAAYLGEMGITNRFNLVESTSLGRNVTPFDPVPDNAPCEDDSSVNCGEDPEDDIGAFARFMRSTKAPPRDRDLVPDDASDPGSQRFDTLGCAVCHVRDIHTTASPATSFHGGTFVAGPLAGKVYHPFGDFLLHDIGTGDGIVEQVGGEATRNMVRTAPLWGVRTRSRLMHDGGSSSPPSNSGAQSFTFNEAILRHAGQATSARNGYQALTPMQKAQLLHFLKSL